MPKAFWTVRPATQDELGGWGPSFPANFIPLRMQNYGDLRIFGPDPAPGDHRHAQMGCLALGTNHYHWMLFSENGQTWHQDYVGGGANEHTHDIPVDRTHFFVFIICTNAAYNQLLSDLPNLIICGEAPVTRNDDPDGSTSWSIGPIDNTLWDVTTRTYWESLFDNFGLPLPEKITNDRRLVRWVLAIFFNSQQNMRTDEVYRYRSVSGVPE